MGDHIFTTAELQRDPLGPADRVVELLPGIWCDRPPTTLDKCRAVNLWRDDAVLSHRSAGWLYGLCPEPDVIEAYVSSFPRRPVPPWLHLRLGP